MLLSARPAHRQQHCYQVPCSQATALLPSVLLTGSSTATECTTCSQATCSTVPQCPAHRNNAVTECTTCSQATALLPSALLTGNSTVTECPAHRQQHCYRVPCSQEQHCYRVHALLTGNSTVTQCPAHRQPHCYRVHALVTGNRSVIAAHLPLFLSAGLNDLRWPCEPHAVRGSQHTLRAGVTR